MRAFVAVHSAASFSGAALALGVPRSTMSRAVAALEESLGVLLFVRTTRRVTTTPAGIALFERVAPSLGRIDTALADLPDRKEEPSGTLRLTTTPDLGTMLVAEAVARYTARYPQTQVELQLDSAIVDLVRDRFDLALRVSQGRPRDSALVSRKVGDIVFQLYAAPAYLARRGTPRKPAELRGHDVVAFRGAEAMPLPSATARNVAPARPRVICNDMFFAREVLRTGAGIGALPSFVADRDVTEGRLVQLLPRWLSRRGVVSLVQPSRKHVPRRVTAFRDLLLELLRQRPLSAAGAG